MISSTGTPSKYPFEELESFMLENHYTLSDIYAMTYSEVYLRYCIEVQKHKERYQAQLAAIGKG